MIVAGVDIGSSMAKAVILEDGKVLGTGIVPTGSNSAETARLVVEKALNASGLSMKDNAYTVSTGYGRVNVPFSQKHITEISSHALGMVSIFPQVRTILDMGGQDCKAIQCDGQGSVQKFVMNDKCAAGTGRYLERTAQALNVTLDDIGLLSLNTVEGPALISNYCTVFAQRDVVSLLRQGTHVNDILAGVCGALAERIQVLVKRLGIVEDFSISGGVAKNIGMVSRLEKTLGVRARIPPEPLIVGALGAAFFAQRLARKS